MNIDNPARRYSHAKDKRQGLANPGLQFDQPTPVAPEGLGGLIRDHFSNGRLFATVGWHQGLVNISYWGRQHLGGPAFFQGSLDGAWTKLFRTCAGLGDKRYYLPLSHTKLYPFGLSGNSHLEGMDFKQEILLLPDALVQRFQALRNPKKLPVFIEMFHQEQGCRVNRANRTWSDFAFNARGNAMVCRCTDTNPDVHPVDHSLAQQGMAIARDAARATTWIGLGCNAPIQSRPTHQGFKLYLTSKPIAQGEACFFVVFAESREKLEQRLRYLSAHASRECDALLADYQQRLTRRPRIDLGNKVLNSAFAQYPQAIHFMKIPDQPGAVKATQAGYFVWGWDGMMPMVPCTLANEPEYTAAILRFFQKTCHPKLGLPHQFTTSFTLKMKAPIPAQTQYITGLYQYLATTGHLALAKEVLPTCKFILNQCRKNLVRDTGLVAGSALWPDFPEAMEENGHDISSLNNSLVYQALRAMEYIALACSQPALARECRDWAVQLRANFVKYLFDQEYGYFISSCSSRDFKPRKHYCCQAILWLTPFARELVAHDPQRIAAFMNQHLRSARCLLSLPRWDTAWMADGNQLGSSFPAADYFYLNMQKITANTRGLKAWLGDLQWFWQYHTAPEAFTPETENENLFGPDNHGCKQLQALSTWYSGLYNGVAGMDFDHEGITFTPWHDIPLTIRGLVLRGKRLDITIRGAGEHIQTLQLNGRALPAGSRKIAWNMLRSPHSKLDLLRTHQPPKHPVIVRADGLAVTQVSTKPGHLAAGVTGAISGEVIIQTQPGAKVIVDGEAFPQARVSATGTVCIPFDRAGKMKLDILQ